jgi:hypothetical protein
MSTAEETAVIEAFSRAYHTALEKGTPRGSQTRMEHALEAGGQAVVRYLLSGKDIFWLNSYAKQSIENANNNAEHYQDDRSAIGYPEKRRNVFLSQGRVSDRINFTPDEMTGGNVNKEIARTLVNFGIQVETSAKNTVPAPRRQSSLAIPARKV